MYVVVCTDVQCSYSRSITVPTYVSPTAAGRNKKKSIIINNNWIVSALRSCVLNNVLEHKFHSIGDVDRDID